MENNNNREEFMAKYGYLPHKFRVRLLNYYGDIGTRVSIRTGYVHKDDSKPNLNTIETTFNQKYSSRAVIEKIKRDVNYE